MFVKEDLIPFENLMELLGYVDERSLKAWCRRSKIPIIDLGAKKYILSQNLTQVIENQLVIFAKANAIDPNTLISALKEETVQNSQSEISSGEKSQSKVSEKFLSQIKSIINEKIPEKFKGCGIRVHCLKCRSK